MSAIDELDSGAALRAAVQSENRGVFVDFWSPWCAPCRTMRPHLNRMAEEYKADWRFVAVNADADKDAAADFNVKSLPTLIFYRDGEETFRFAGSAAISSIAEKLDELGPSDS